MSSTSTPSSFAKSSRYLPCHAGKTAAQPYSCSRILNHAAGHRTSDALFLSTEYILSNDRRLHTEIAQVQWSRKHHSDSVQCSETSIANLLLPKSPAYQPYHFENSPWGEKFESSIVLCARTTWRDDTTTPHLDHHSSMHAESLARCAHPLNTT